MLSEVVFSLLQETNQHNQQQKTRLEKEYFRQGKLTIGKFMVLKNSIV